MSLSVGSGCGSFGRAVASVTRRLQFESSHHKIYNEQCLPTVNCIKKTKNKEKRPEMAHIQECFCHKNKRSRQTRIFLFCH